jgi:hypothetical protein
VDAQDGSQRQRIRARRSDQVERHQEGAEHRPGSPIGRGLDQRLTAGADRDAVGRVQAVGHRQLGKEGVEDFLEKTVYLNLAD